MLYIGLRVGKVVNLSWTSNRIMHNRPEELLKLKYKGCLKEGYLDHKSFFITREPVIKSTMHLRGKILDSLHFILKLPYVYAQVHILMMVCR